jgi:hypothetical protein
MPIKTRYIVDFLMAACAIVLFSGCGAGSSEATAVKSHKHDTTDMSEYKDFFQLVAAGSDCNDLQWMAGHCAADPSGSWSGGAGPGFCGDAAKSCHYAVAKRNQTLGCWQDGQTPACDSL